MTPYRDSDFSKPEDRVMKQEFSPEFARTVSDAGFDDMEERVEQAALRLERSHAAVAWASRASEFYGDTEGYVMYALPKQDADRDDIARAMQSAFTWILNGGGRDD